MALEILYRCDYDIGKALSFISAFDPSFPYTAIEACNRCLDDSDEEEEGEREEDTESQLKHSNNFDAMPVDNAAAVIASSSDSQPDGATEVNGGNVPQFQKLDAPNLSCEVLYSQFSSPVYTVGYPVMGDYDKNIFTKAMKSKKQDWVKVAVKSLHFHYVIYFSLMYSNFAEIYGREVYRCRASRLLLRKVAR
jgi:hypothetical protein